MIQFIQNIFKFVGLFFILSFIICIIFYITSDVSLKEVPAPNLSNSYSFNEKIRFLKTKQKEIEIISIGSSCTLNNLSSEVVVSKLNTNSFLNTSSWGLNMKDIFNMLKMFNLEYNFKNIIIVSTFQDFQREEKIINEPLISNYLNSDPTGLFTHLKSFNLRYYFNNFSYSKKVRNDSLGFNNLIFDEYGAVPLNIMKNKTKDKRWKLNFLKDKFKSDQYDFLDSIANYCFKNNIKLYFFQSPIREGIFSNMNEEEVKNYTQHIKKIKKIITAKKFDFVNPDNVLWSDTLFNDAVHFNKIGAIQFTESCFDNLDKQ